MNGLPAEMIDRWEDRAEPAPGEGLIYWHMLVGTDPDVIALVREARRKLARFSGLHMTPYAWLHMTALIAGDASEITGEQIRQMASVAGRLLADIPPPTVTVGKILYHPEAIMLAAHPAEALQPVMEATREATQTVTGNPGRAGNKLPWTPHITIAYSTSRQPAAPIITALGQSLPERKVQISAISIVNQQGPERGWDWQPEATIRFGTPTDLDITH
jgi:2'-5' RNA ligase